jgi:hypothetical protein
MYKFITVARNTREVWNTPMYIYKNIENDKYYITRMFPVNSKFAGSNLSDPTEYPIIEFPQELTNENLSNNKINYWNQEWTFRI